MTERTLHLKFDNQLKTTTFVNDRFLVDITSIKVHLIDEYTRDILEIGFLELKRPIRITGSCLSFKESCYDEDFDGYIYTFEIYDRKPRLIDDVTLVLHKESKVGFLC